MDTLDFKLPHGEVTLVLDALRHYIKYIEHLKDNDVDDDTYADLQTDRMNLVAVERTLSEDFQRKFGKY